ncbi:hypothetical protein ADL27_29080 [Streptomyces sp. NRRL F-6602]|nr:hypothetical protein ADL27_29080 [Streptomyces sp. NRRL F-6602]
MRERPTPVLMHSPLVGPSSWRPVAAALRARGYATVVPSLSPVLGSRDGWYPRMAAAVAHEVARHGGAGRTVLVAHSGAGALLPAVAEATAAPVVGAVFVDALLPHPGRGWTSTVPEALRERLRGLVRDGLLPPWDEWFPPGTVEELLPDPRMYARFRAELPHVPWAFLKEPAPEVPDLPPSRCAYLRLSEAYEAETQEAERRGWAVARHAAHHLAPLTAPQEVGAALEALLDRLGH